MCVLCVFVRKLKLYYYNKQVDTQFSRRWFCWWASAHVLVVLRYAAAILRTKTTEFVAIVHSVLAGATSYIISHGHQHRLSFCVKTIISVLMLYRHYNFLDLEQNRNRTQNETSITDCESAFRCDAIQFHKYFFLQVPPQVAREIYNAFLPKHH